MLELNLSGHAFNFSAEKPLDGLDMTNKILQIMGSNLQPVILNEAKNEIAEQYLSAEKARQLLNWKPLFDIDEGLQRTVDWYKQYFSYSSKFRSKFEQSSHNYQTLPLPYEEF